MKSLLTLSDRELEKWLSERSLPAYRAKQIFPWIFDKWIINPCDMKNIPLDLRNILADSFVYGQSEIINTELSGDMTEKTVISLHDGECIETVIIRTDERITFCLSSQVGCAVQCRFCASGKDGLVRNLSAEEIIEHLLLCCRQAGSRPDNIVFMGIGEPLMNVDNLISALDIISSPERFRISPRRITVSTNGWIPGIKKFAEIAKPYNLALSLHGPDDKTRARLIPDKYRRDIADIMDACDYYREKSRRMITFEYTLIKDINDSPEQAEELMILAKKHHAKINIIPYNPVDSAPFKRPSESAIYAFLKILEKGGVQVTCRLRKGDTINAACGQLRKNSMAEGKLNILPERSDGLVMISNSPKGLRSNNEYPMMKEKNAETNTITNNQQPATK